MDYLDGAIRFVGMTSGLLAVVMFTMGSTHWGRGKLLDGYVYVHNTVKRLKKGNTPEYIPCYNTVSVSDQTQAVSQHSLWALNVSHIELFDYQNTELEEIIHNGIAKFRVAFPTDRKARSEINAQNVDLWEIARNEFKRIYPKKEFPNKIVIHLLSETLLFTKLSVKHNPDFTIVLEKGNLQSLSLK